MRTSVCVSGEEIELSEIIEGDVSSLRLGVFGREPREYMLLDLVGDKFSAEPLIGGCEVVDSTEPLLDWFCLCLVPLPWPGPYGER